MFPPNFLCSNETGLKQTDSAKNSCALLPQSQQTYALSNTSLSVLCECLEHSTSQTNAFSSLA